MGRKGKKAKQLKPKKENVSDGKVSDECRHVSKSVKYDFVRNSFRQSDVGLCKDCTNVQTDNKKVHAQGLCICLKCGYQACNLQSDTKHAYKHFKDVASHSIAMNIDDWSIWCYMCDKEIIVQENTYPTISKIINFLKHAITKEGKIPTILGGNEKKTVKGLRNLGNTCFFNAIMQSLVQTDVLQRSLDECFDDDKVIKIKTKKLGLNICIEDAPSLLTSSLHRLLKELSTGLSKVLHPGQLLTQISKKAPQFGGFQQQDSHELLRYLLDSIRMEETQRIEKALKLSVSRLDEDSKPTPDDIKDSLRGVKTFIDEIFGGVLVSIISCRECKRKSWVYEDFLDLSLPISMAIVDSTQMKTKKQKVDVSNTRKEKVAIEHEDSKHQKKMKAKAARKAAKKSRRRSKSFTESNQDETEISVAVDDKCLPVDASCKDSKGICEVIASDIVNDLTIDESTSANSESVISANDEVSLEKDSLEVGRNVESNVESNNESNVESNNESNVESNNESNVESNNESNETIRNVESNKAIRNVESNGAISTDSKSSTRESDGQQIDCLQIEDHVGLNDHTEQERLPKRREQNIDNTSESYGNIIEWREKGSYVILTNKCEGGEDGPNIHPEGDHTPQGSDDTSETSAKETKKTSGNIAIPSVKNTVKQEDEECKEEEIISTPNEHSVEKKDNITHDSPNEQIVEEKVQDINDSSNEQSVQDKVQDSNDSSNEQSVQDKVQDSNDSSNEQSVQDKVQDSNDSSNEHSVEEKVQDSNDSSNEHSDDSSNEQSFQDKVQDSNDSSNEHSVEEKVQDSNDSSNEQSVQVKVQNSNDSSNEHSVEDKVQDSNDSSNEQSVQDKVQDSNDSSNEQSVQDKVQYSNDSSNEHSDDSSNEQSFQDKVQDSNDSSNEQSVQDKVQYSNDSSNEQSVEEKVQDVNDSSNEHSVEKKDNITHDSPNEQIVEEKVQDSNESSNEHSVQEKVQDISDSSNEHSVEDKVQDINDSSNEHSVKEKVQDINDSSNEHSVEDKVQDSNDSSNENYMGDEESDALVPSDDGTHASNSLSGLLQKFCSVEVLEGKNKFACEYCTERCKEKSGGDKKTIFTDATKRFLLHKLPTILTLHLKRFEQVGVRQLRKVSKYIEYPLLLNMTSFCARSTESSNGSLLYSLYGIVEHKGSLQSGHYVAYVKVKQANRNYKWYYISDQNFSVVTETEVLKKQAYLLFYEQVAASNT